MDLRRVEQDAWDNKLAHGFNTIDVKADLKRLGGEVGEAAEAWEQGGTGFGSELADVVIYTCGLAQMAGLDLGAEVKDKPAVNAGRHYERMPGGRLVKADPTPAEPDLEAG